MLRTKTGLLILLLLGILALGGGLRAMSKQDLKDFNVSEEVGADQAVLFPVDI